MTDHEKTSRDYLEAWRTSQAEMQRLRDALDAEREKVRVLREAANLALQIAEKWMDENNDGRRHLEYGLSLFDAVRQALAAAEPEDV